MNLIELRRLSALSFDEVPYELFWKVEDLIPVLENFNNHIMEQLYE